MLRWPALFLFAGAALAPAQRVIPDNPPARAISSRAPDVPELPRSITFGLPPRPAFSLPDAPPFVPQASNQIGFHRALPAGVLTNGGWRNLPSGQSIWTLTLRSPGARSLRVHFLDFHIGSGKVFLFAAGDTVGDTARGPYSGDGPLGSGEFWSGSVFADTLVLEYIPADRSDRSLPFQIDKVSHVVTGLPSPAASLVPILNLDRPAGPASTVDLPMRSAVSLDPESAAAACQLDVSCYGTYSDASNGIALIYTEDATGSYSCTGWLVNTRSSSLIPYLITNNHCISSQSIANTVEAHWKYRTSYCNGPRPSVPPMQSVGSTLLATRPNTELDFAFVRLPSAPPNAYFMGWTLDHPAAGSSIVSMGHPRGDYQRIVFATVQTGTKFAFKPTQGFTEGGSSGSPWMNQPGVAFGLHARGTAVNYPDPCRAFQNGLITGSGEWFGDIYPLIASYLEDQAACSYSLGAQSASFSSNAGDGSVAVTTRTGCSWTAVSNASWITITGGASGSGNGTVSYNVSQNYSASPRSGTMTIAGRTYTVNQAGASVTCTPSAISIGSSVSGNLTSGCTSPLQAGRYAARYSFSAAAGQNIVISAVSSAVDTYLFLIGPSGAILAQDDDGGSGSNARVPTGTGSFHLTSAGTYVIEVTSFGAGETGSFRLSITAEGCAIQTIAFGQTVSGQLTTTDCLSPEGPYFTDYYTFQGTAGQRVWILETSPTMDTYLILDGPNGAIVSWDDDSAGNLNSRIPPGGFFTLPATGTYTIEASAFNEYEIGSYELTLTSDSPPPSGNGPFRLVAVTPCRIMDTRDPSGTFGGPVMSGSTTRVVPIPQSGCGIPSTAQAYSLNITVVPRGPLSFLTIWPSGRDRPLVSTLNSFDGRVVANAAIVPAGSSGSISVFVTDMTDVIIDINGFFAP